MNYALILAGGVGSRFWPLSRESQPKQFLNIYSSKPMIEETIDRISWLIKKKNIYIATSRNYQQNIKRCLKKINISLHNVLFEPESKNTFAPIAVLAKDIDSFDSEAIIAVLPSDHFIKYEKRFLKLLSRGIEIARKGYIVSLGITPDSPETGYGYIKTKSKIHDFYLIERFIEKPNLARAKKFIRDKGYYWNSGIFIFSPSLMLKEAKKFMPSAYNIVMQIKDKKDFIRLWRKLPSISIDYAIMEKTKRIALLPTHCAWSDLGSWGAIGEIAKKDKNGNIFRGKYIDIASKNTIVYSDNRLVTTLGLDNIIIIDTPDALLVCAKDRSQDVKKMVQLLKQRNFKGQL